MACYHASAQLTYFSTETHLYNTQYPPNLNHHFSHHNLHLIGLLSLPNYSSYYQTTMCQWIRLIFVCGCQHDKIGSCKYAENTGRSRPVRMKPANLRVEYSTERWCIRCKPKEPENPMEEPRGPTWRDNETPVPTKTTAEYVLPCLRYDVC